MNDWLSRIANEYGTPCFVYRMDNVKERIQHTRRLFGNRLLLSYAVKSNPNPTLLRRLQSHVDILDVSSGGELVRAVKVGWQPQLLSFTGPAKRDDELQTAVTHQIGAVIVESINEAERLNRFAERAGVVQPILIRVAPLKLPKGFGVRMAGKPSQFGIDEEELDLALKLIKPMKSLSLQGFHIYSGTQCLIPESVVENYKIFIDIFRRASETHGIEPKKLIFGSGLGIPYHDEDQPLDLAAIAEAINPALDELRHQKRFSQTDFILEVGRYFVGEAGLYLTRILNKKRSRGTDICICDGGMNHHLGACGHLGTVIHRNYQMFKVETPEGSELRQPYDLFGPLCTSIDRLGHAVQLPSLEIGDVIAVRCSGAYGLTASPVYFISHELPKEILIETVDGEVKIEDVSHLPTRLSSNT